VVRRGRPEKGKGESGKKQTRTVGETLIVEGHFALRGSKRGVEMTVCFRRREKKKGTGMQEGRRELHEPVDTLNEGAKGAGKEKGLGKSNETRQFSAGGGTQQQDKTTSQGGCEKRLQSRQVKGVEQILKKDLSWG